MYSFKVHVALACLCVGMAMMGERRRYLRRMSHELHNWNMTWGFRRRRRGEPGDNIEGEEEAEPE